MADYTPGPYHIVQSRYGSRDYIQDAKGETIGETTNTSLNYHANARLFAAAPDLLAALQAFIGAEDLGKGIDGESYETYCAAFEVAEDLARAAVNKAIQVAGPKD